MLRPLERKFGGIISYTVLSAKKTEFNLDLEMLLSRHVPLPLCLCFLCVYACVCLCVCVVACLGSCWSILNQCFVLQMTKTTIEGQEENRKWEKGMYEAGNFTGNFYP